METDRIVIFIQQMIDNASGYVPNAPLMMEQFDQNGKEQSGFWSWIRSIDAFPKFDTEYLRKTSSGGLGSVICFAIMGLLMAVEVWKWVVPTVGHEFVVDNSIQPTVPINFSISVGSPCEALMLVIAEETGRTRGLNGYSGDILMEPIYFPQDPKHDRIKLMTARENERKSDAPPPPGFHYGCRITTLRPIEIERLDCKLMVLPVTDFMGVFGALIMAMDQSINFSHIIHRMSFGRDYPGQRNPLNGQAQPAMQFHEDFTYFLSILPTKYRGLWRSQLISSNQYSLTGFLGQKDPQKVEKPGLFFNIKMEPLSVVIRQYRTPFRSFLINLVGILGGVYTCFGIINSLVVTVYDWITGKHAAKRRKTSAALGGSIDMTSIDQENLAALEHEQLMAKAEPQMVV